MVRLNGCTLLGVHLTGEKSGVWSDFATDDKGDLLDLWAAVRNLTLSAAINDACDYLGISKPKFEAYKPTNFVKPVQKTTSELLLSSPVARYLLNERKLNQETIELNATRNFFPQEIFKAY